MKLQTLLARWRAASRRRDPVRRYVANKRAEKELRFQNARDALGRRRGVADGSVAVIGDGGRVGSPRASNRRPGFRPAAFLRARRLGQGAYGTVFRVDGTDDPEFARLPRRLEYRVSRGRPPPGRAVALKVTQGKIDELVREAAVHRRLSSSRACWTPRGATRQLCSSAHVPVFYFSGQARGQDGRPYYATVMGLVRGQTVWDRLRQRRLDARAYVAVERAAASLWAQGVAHADLHAGNIFYDGATAVIVDMGLAVVLPTRMMAGLRAAMARGVADGVPCLAEVFGRPWRPSRYGVRDARGFLDRVMHARGLTWFNADYTALRALYDMLHPDEQAKVPRYRLAAWGMRSRRVKA